MKIILSRKGFDSSYGGVPSPLLDDGTLISLPIPDEGAKAVCRYADLAPRGISLGSIVADLTKNKIRAARRVHLDPDLDRTALRRHRQWLPAFGQAGAAQAHLANQDVGPGDVFLFFGWFRRVCSVDGRWQYVPLSRHLHIIFGWLRVGRLLYPGEEQAPAGLELHPHFTYARDYPSPNCIYVADPTSTGAGIFPKYCPALQLTADGCDRSTWQLPSWFNPNGRPALTYHGDDHRWTRNRAGVLLQSVAKGQEFVLDADEYPEAEAWLQNILKCAA